MNEDYVAGFMAKAAALGVDPEALVKSAEETTPASQRANALAGLIGAGTGAGLGVPAGRAVADKAVRDYARSNAAEILQEIVDADGPQRSLATRYGSRLKTIGRLARGGMPVVLGLGGLALGRALMPNEEAT
jgi:hypothetical protein